MIDDRLVQVVARVFQLDPADVTPGLGVGSIERWDSLGHLQLLMKLEETFHVRFDTKSIPTLTTMTKIEANLKELGALR